jgi:hypothetical protein
MRCLALVPFAVLAPGLRPALAQGAPLPPPGAVVRVRTVAPGAVAREGVVLSADADSLRFVVRGAGDTAGVGLRDIARLEVSRGRRRNTWRGARRGALYGSVGLGLAGGTWNLVAPSLTGGSCYALCSPAEGALAGAIVGAVFGTLVGTSVGAFIRTERWAPVVLPPAAGRSGARPWPGGARVGVSHGLAAW